MANLLVVSCCKPVLSRFCRPLEHSGKFNKDGNGACSISPFDNVLHLASESSRHTAHDSGCLAPVNHSARSPCLERGLQCTGGRSAAQVRQNGQPTRRHGPQTLTPRPRVQVVTALPLMVRSYLRTRLCSLHGLHEPPALQITRMCCVRRAQVVLSTHCQ